MLADWRHAYANIALTGGNLAFLLIVAKYPTPAGLTAAAGMVGASSLFAWYANLRRYRTVADTPTSRVNSAPQGYIELDGKGVHPDGERLVSPFSGLPCLWYRHLVEEKIRNKWRRIKTDVSSKILGLDDGTGFMLIDPVDAEVITTNKTVRTNGRLRHTEWTLLEGERIYVIGEHTTQSGSTVALNTRQDVSDLLADWKQNKENLLKRFDMDGDGHISLDEWESARKAAEMQVEHTHRKIRLQTGTSMIRKPEGRLYLIANRSPEQMISRYLIWARIHLGLLIAASLTIAIVL